MRVSADIPLISADSACWLYRVRQHVFLRHSWKAMWTRLADWPVMSNSLPQKGRRAGVWAAWVGCLYVCVIVCTYMCKQDGLKLFFFLYSQQEFPSCFISHFHRAEKFSRGRAEYQWGHCDIDRSFFRRQSIGWGGWNTKEVGSNKTQGLSFSCTTRSHRAVFQPAPLTLPLRLLSHGPDLVLHSRKIKKHGTLA